MRCKIFTLAELQAARRTALELIVVDRRYMPLVRRLEAEIAEVQKDEELLAEARAVVNG